MAKVMLLIILFPFLSIMCYLMKQATNEQNGMYYGVRISPEIHSQEFITKIHYKYRQRQHRILLITIILSTSIFIMPSAPLAFTALYIWVYFAFTFSFIPYVKANSEMKDFMLVADAPDPEQKIKELKQSEEKHRRYPIFGYCFLFFINIAPIIYQMTIRDVTDLSISLLILLLVISLFNLLIFICDYYVRSQYQILCLDLRLNQQLNTLRKKHYRWCYRLMLYANMIYFFAMFCAFSKIVAYNNYYIVATYIYISILTLILLNCLAQNYRSKQKFIKEHHISMDESEHWIWGLFYHNTEDKRLLVPSRFCSNCSYKTVNYGRLRGKLLNIFTNLLGFSGLCLCLWSVFTFYTPISLIVTNDQLIAKQLRNEYVIPFDTIEDYSLLEELPFLVINQEFKTVSKGLYMLSDNTTYQLFLSPVNTFFIKVTTDEKNFLLSSSTDDETIEIYDELLNSIGR